MMNRAHEEGGDGSDRQTHPGPDQGQENSRIGTAGQRRKEGEEKKKKGPSDNKTVTGEPRT
jgi:hypothetical protein